MMPHCGAWAFWGESGVEERVDPHRTRPRRRQRRGGSAPRSGGGACPGTRLCPSRNPTDGTASMIAMHQTQSVGFYAEFFYACRFAVVHPPKFRLSLLRRCLSVHAQFGKTESVSTSQGKRSNRSTVVYAMRDEWSRFHRNTYPHSFFSGDCKSNNSVLVSSAMWAKKNQKNRGGVSPNVVSHPLN